MPYVTQRRASLETPKSSETDAELLARDAKRDIGAELLQSVRQMSHCG